MNSLLTLHTKDLQSLYVKGLQGQMKEAAGKPTVIKKLEKELKKANKLKVNKIERYYQEAYAAAHPNAVKSKKTNENADQTVSASSAIVST